MASSAPTTLSAALDALVTADCMERTTYEHSTKGSDRRGGSRLQLPVYVAHARRLARRRQHIDQQLYGISAADVTMVLCADADELSVVHGHLMQLLHPAYTRTAWSPSGRTRLPNGTLSLALKHRLAHLDAFRRGLRAALVIEDDAVLPSSLPDQLRRHLAHLPSDAALFYAGSYSRSTNPRLTLAELPRLPNVEPPIHQRVNGSASDRPPHILGTVAYVVLARGAKLLHDQPIRAEADVDLSLLPPTRQCGQTSPRCAVASPAVQYGPPRWLVWQDEALSKELTHGSSKDSVREGWARACANARPADLALLRACHRFGIVRLKERKPWQDVEATVRDLER